MAHFKEITKTITDFFKSLYDSFNERILPSLKESYNHVEKILMDLFDEILVVAANLSERLVEALKKFEKDFKQISQTISETSKKVTKFLGEQFEALQRELEDIYKLIVDYFKSLPGFDALKEKYQEVNDMFFFLILRPFTVEFFKMIENIFFLSFCCSCYSEFHTVIPKNSRNTMQKQ